MADDSELLRRYAEAHSQAAFSEFVGRHLRLVYCTALRRTGDRSDLAEDVAQAVFIKVARNAPSLSRRSSMAGWLYMATRFAANDLMRSEHRRALREELAELLPAGVGSSSQDSLEALRSLTDNLLDYLSRVDREIVLLRHFDGQSFDEIGRNLQIPGDTARKRADRAIEKLRSRLYKQGITSTGAALVATFSQQSIMGMPVGIDSAISQAVSAIPPAGVSGSFFSRVLEASQVLGGAAGLVAVFTIGVAVYEVRAEQHMEAAWAAAKCSLETAADKLREQEKLVQTSTAELPGVVSGPGALKKIASTSPASADSASRQLGRQFLAAHPEAQRLIDQQARDHVSWWIAPIGRKAGLTPAQIEQIVTICTEAQGPFGSLTGDFGTVSFDQNSPRKLSGAEAEQQIQALVGDEAYARLTDIRRTGTAINMATDAAAALNSSNMPLTPQETQGLEQIIASASPDYQSGKSVNASNLDWDSIVGQARALLSPDQMQAIQALRARQGAENDEAAYWQVLRGTVNRSP